MWILISGPPGTSKHKIAKALESKEGFQYEAWSITVDEDLEPFSKELLYATRHIRSQFELEAVRFKRNIVTIGSAWEAPIYSEVAFKRSDIKKEEVKVLRALYSAFVDALKPPDAIIFMNCTDKMASFNKMLLDKKVIHQEAFMDILAAYDEFRGKLAPPVIEVEHGHTFDNIWHTVQFGIQSLKSGGLSGDTIWKKGIFK